MKRELNEKQVERVLVALIERGFVKVEFNRRGFKRYWITPAGVDYMRGLLYGRADADDLNGPRDRKSRAATGSPVSSPLSAGSRGEVRARRRSRS